MNDAKKKDSFPTPARDSLWKRARELKAEEASGGIDKGHNREIMELLALCDVPKPLLSLVGNRMFPKDRGPKKDSAQNLEKRAIAAAYFVSIGRYPEANEEGRFSHVDKRIITDCARRISGEIGDTNTRNSLPEDRRRKSVKGYLADEDFRFVVESLIREFQESAFPGVDEIKRWAKLALETVAVNRLREHSRGDHTDLSEAADSSPAD